MPNNNAVAQTYLHGNLLNSIQNALTQLGKNIDNITIDDLSPVDEFHIGGRIATERFLDQLKFSTDSHVLDIGCGLGGSARFAANKYNNQVTGIDLSPEYIETGKVLCEWVKLDKQITLKQGSALDMPFIDGHFDGAYMLHVGMNIEDKSTLFAELNRVLRPGSYLGIYDVMQQEQGELAFPIPWATNSSTSYLATPDSYIQALDNAGFKLVTQTNRRDFAIEFFNRLRAKTEAKGGPPALGLHTLMQESTSEKIGNMIKNIADNYIAPVELVVQKN